MHVCMAKQGRVRMTCLHGPQVLQSHDSIDSDVLHPAHNLVVRAVARSGSPVVAYERLEQMVTGKQTITVEMETVSAA